MNSGPWIWCLLTPGSGIGFFRVPELGSPTHILESLVTIFWVKKSKQFSVNWQKFFSVPVQKLNNFLFCEVCGYKNGKTTNFLPPFLFVAAVGWIKSGSGINSKHPESATLTAVQNSVNCKHHPVFYHGGARKPMESRLYWTATLVRQIVWVRGIQSCSNPPVFLPTHTL